jgi:hypothetical protein
VNSVQKGTAPWLDALFFGCHLEPIVRRDGRMIYRVADGVVVMDEARHVSVSQVTPSAIYLALSPAPNALKIVRSW